MTTSNFGARYFSLFLQIFVFAMNGTIYACEDTPTNDYTSPFVKAQSLTPSPPPGISSSIPRPPAKRAAALAFINSVGNAASIWTPFTYRAQDAPFYRPAIGCCIALQCLAAGCAFALKVLLEKQNARLERLDNADSQLTDRDVKRLEKTAEVEGLTVEEARSLQRGFRFVI